MKNRKMPLIITENEMKVCKYSTFQIDREIWLFLLFPNGCKAYKEIDKELLDFFNDASKTLEEFERDEKK